MSFDKIEYMRAWRAKNKDRIAAYKKAYFRENSSRTRAADAKRQKEWRRRNPDKLKAQSRRAYLKNKEAKLRYSKHRNKTHEATILALRAWRKSPNGRKGDARRTAELTDGVVRKMLCSHGSALSAASVPQALIDLKRVHIKLLRLLKETKA